MELDIYGKVHTFAGRSLSDCPFRWQGQYEDAETGLYYNRHRYYDPDTGNYISQDPIGLEGGAALYAYVHDPNSWIDPFGLKNWNYHNMPEIDGFQKHHIIPKSLSEGARPHEIFKLSGYDVHNTKNVIYLPTDRRYHKTRSIHDGFNKFHSQYNADIRSQLTDLVEVGKANNWTKQQYHDALQNVINDTRQDLRKGKTKLHCKG
jgi:RHS repeat-associated protein